LVGLALKGVVYGLRNGFVDCSLDPRHGGAALPPTMTRAATDISPIRSRGAVKLLRTAISLGTVLAAAFWLLQTLGLKGSMIVMFYGDVLTHTIPGAHWEVIEEGYPLVRVTRNVAVDAVRVATRRLAISEPTLKQNYAHVMKTVKADPF
jgi:hypothetical protein